VSLTQTESLDELLARAERWIADDPDPITRAQLTEAIAAARSGDQGTRITLTDAFNGTLSFGTAGLRGAVAPGPNRMNRAVVSRAAAGLSAYLQTQGGGTIVVGYDARHRSDDFARDTCEIAAGAGLRALLLPRPLPTPVLAYAVRHLGAQAGVMVTASHNPPQDNGYKVYLGGGWQIVPPVDAEIAAHIAAVESVLSLPREDNWSTLDDEVLESYLDRVVSLVPESAPRSVIVGYTPMHGVGRDTFVETLQRSGFDAPHVVAEQGEPDPDFPTVVFPNPEEPGAMDLAKALGERVGADIVIANDPDADRAAAAVPAADGSGFVMLRGDEVGALLGWWLIERARRNGETITGIYANSIVSASLLGKIASAAGLEFLQTLTGFKWIGRVDGLTFGYEEALGYCVDPEAVRDKDGISAGLLLAELTAALKAEGRTVHDVLDDLAREHGLYATDQLSVRVSDVSIIADSMARLRANPPAVLGGVNVAEAQDLERGSEALPPTDGLRYLLDGGARVIVRPSGTEPKIKCYLEVVVPVSDGDVAGARRQATATLAAMRVDLADAAGLVV